MDYSMLKTEVICQLHMVALEVDNEIGKIYDTLLCDPSNQRARGWEDARQSFEDFEREESIGMWKLLADRARAAEDRRLVYDNNITIIREHWRRKGDGLLDLNMSPLFVSLFSELACKYHYSEAMRRLCRATHWRLTNTKTTGSPSRMVTYADFCSVLDKPDLGQEPLSDEELSQIECQVGPLGLLEPRLPDGKEK